ncbi:phage neck terminator protein [Piscirickettsia salmonis]|uniref:phage neck terminator protein n=1 Tax=Piscirickettsia salmonis TaxID=1238 RepID=UPI003EBD09BC
MNIQPLQTALLNTLKENTSEKLIIGYQKNLRLNQFTSLRYYNAKMIGQANETPCDEGVQVTQLYELIFFIEALGLDSASRATQLASTFRLASQKNKLSAQGLKFFKCGPLQDATTFLSTDYNLRTRFTAHFYAQDIRIDAVGLIDDYSLELIAEDQEQAIISDETIEIGDNDGEP